MKDKGCGANRIVDTNRVLLSDLCTYNVRGAGEFGHVSDELALESLSLELQEPGSSAPEALGLHELWGTPWGTFMSVDVCDIDI